LDDIEDATEEIRSRGEDEYFDLETRIKDALVQAQQDEIDKLSEINNSINDTNARLLETMQYNLEQERKMRENDKTEQELEDKQRRLEYLSQDTSGANALEIKQLEEEIAEGQQDYTDTLIDQKISEL
jgi:translation initiation factor IF-3